MAEPQLPLLHDGPVASARALTGHVVPVSGQERDLLCALSYVHLACGQHAQGLALLRLLDHEETRDIGLLRILAYGLVSDGAGEEALTVLDRLEGLDDQPGARLPLTLLRSHALRRAGRMEEAKLAFRDYVALRASASRPDVSPGRRR
jgi:Flp pilus assembly protein TadD